MCNGQPKKKVIGGTISYNWRGKQQEVLSLQSTITRAIRSWYFYEFDAEIWLAVLLALARTMIIEWGW